VSQLAASQISCNLGVSQVPESRAVLRVLSTSSVMQPGANSISCKQGRLQFPAPRGPLVYTLTRGAFSVLQPFAPLQLILQLGALLASCNQGRPTCQQPWAPSVSDNQPRPQYPATRCSLNVIATQPLAICSPRLVRKWPYVILAQFGPLTFYHIGLF
jgi:hypothetical protein